MGIYFSGMRSLDFGIPKHVVKSVFYEILISMRVCVCMHMCVCVHGGADSDCAVEC